ncbi:3',5'-cyclic-AMP phosphodiesterase [Ectothiorhodospiraceae bacterium WFHF3C12]|nr:3',5'-cyclic-AMP phosphodiesterase [Ectothiorhodospiraceae bacterium WFHF3C12]
MHEYTRSSQDCLKVLQITDTHLYADPQGELGGLNTERSYCEVMEKVLRDHWPVDLILATGDIVHDGSVAGYRRFKGQFEDLAVRTLVIPGNHDDPDALRQVMQGGRVTCSENAILGGWQFVMLDSVLPGADGGRLGSDQLQLLERCLADNRGLHTVVCLHHHPVDMGSEWIDRIGVDNADDFWAVIDRHPDVRAVVWGHVHQDLHRRRGSVELFASPSTCIQFKPEEEEFAIDEAPPGYRWFRLYRDGRLESAVERLEEPPGQLDIGCGGY